MYIRRRPDLPLANSAYSRQRREYAKFRATPKVLRPTDALPEKVERASRPVQLSPGKPNAQARSVYSGWPKYFRATPEKYFAYSRLWREYAEFASER